jgi:hypothetical protein
LGAKGQKSNRQPVQARGWTSRPLQTGRRFLLVLPRRRVFTGRWDKIHYPPGAVCRLSIIGFGLGIEPFELTVEVEHGEGQWEAVAKVSAEVQDEGREAVGNWRLPAAPIDPGAASVREIDGSFLSDARFEDARDLDGEGPIWVVARAAGFDGQCVQVMLEREFGPDDWQVVGRAAATVRSGTMRAAVVPAGVT